MNVTGPAHIPALSRPDETSLALRLNQRVAAEVLKVAGDRVTLALEGVQVVAQLTSAEQAAALTERRLAHFVVKDLSGPAITLHLLENGETPAPPTLTEASLIQHLLKAAGLPEDAATLAVARALIHAGLPVAPELVEALKRLLKALDGKGLEQAGRLESDVKLAAALKAAGLPVTPEIMNLMRSQQPSALPGLLGELQAGLEALLRGLQGGRQAARSAPELAELARAALSLINALQIDWEGEPAALAGALRQAARSQGLSIERQLAEAAEGGLDPSAGLFCLAQLRSLLAERGSAHLLESVDRLLDHLRGLQFLNAAPETDPKDGGWLKLEAALACSAERAARAENAPRLRCASLRVARSPEGYAHPIDPDRTRLVLSVELEGGEVVQVDLAVAERQVGVQVLASTEALLLRAEAERAALEAGLEKLGYFLKAAQFNLGRPGPADPLENDLQPLLPDAHAGVSISLEV
jgi:hypothetical protein